MTATVLNTKISEIENKVSDTSSWVTNSALNTKIGEVENKIPDNAKYINTSKFNKLTAENFATRLKQASLVTKTDFDNKLASFNKPITSNKTKHLEVQKKRNSLIIKYYNFFLGKIYFTSDNQPQNMFVCQPIFNVLS